MSRSIESVWTTLRHAGLVAGDAPPTHAVDTPWFVKVLLAFSGWLAALFLLGFFGVALEFLFRSNVAALMVGGILIGAAFALLRWRKNEFVEHLALAVSLMGQVLVIVAMVRWAGSRITLAALLVTLFEIALAVLVPNFVHRVFSALTAALSLAVALASMRAPYLYSGVILVAVAWLWLNEFRFPTRVRAVQAVGYGLVLALIPVQGAVALGFRHWHWYISDNATPWVRPWVGELLVVGVMLYVVWRLLRRHGQHLSARNVALALAGAAVVGVASMAAKGVAVGTVILLLGFAGGNRVLLGLGVASLLFYVSSYYYTLDATLLAKSQTLLVVGLALLAARWLMTRVVFRASEANHG